MLRFRHIACQHTAYHIFQPLHRPAAAAKSPRRASHRETSRYLMSQVPDKSASADLVHTEHQTSGVECVLTTGRWLPSRKASRMCEVDRGWVVNNPPPTNHHPNDGSKLILRGCITGYCPLVWLPDGNGYLQRTLFGQGQRGDWLPAWISWTLPRLLQTYFQL